MDISIILGPFQQFFQSIGVFISSTLQTVYGIYVLISQALPPLYLSLFMFAILAFAIGVIIRLL